jgi:ankyrin repeat protein
MSSVNPKLLIALAVVILLAVVIKVSNPYRKYSTRAYWESATIDLVKELPAEALAPGNRNGGVLMWAAMAVQDPEILTALVQRGANINEADGLFKGTPVTAAAAYTSSPEIIDRLIQLGADIHQKVNNDEDALMIAAQYNTNPGVIERLVFHGADVQRKNYQGRTAFDLAVKNDNDVAIKALTQKMEEKTIDMSNRYSQ